MVYMGSKNRIAKELIPIITDQLQPTWWYIEPFVGGANMIDKIQHPYKLGADSNKYLIALLKYVQDGNQLPEFLSRENYLKVKDNKESYPDWYVGFVGFICSFRGKFFGGYSGLYYTNAGKERNYQQERSNNLLKQNLKDITFKCCSYDQLEIPDNSVIYCDPPYQDTTKYKDSFDSNKFWDWCRIKVSEGNKVYISEYNAPADFKCIWEKQVNSNLGATSKKATEKLFIHKSWL